MSYICMSFNTIFELYNASTPWARSHFISPPSVNKNRQAHEEHADLGQLNPYTARPLYNKRSFNKHSGLEHPKAYTP